MNVIENVKTEKVFHRVHRSGCLECADSGHVTWADEPKERGHGRAVIEQGGVLENDRRTVAVPDRDLKLTHGRSSDQLLNNVAVAVRCRLTREILHVRFDCQIVLLTMLRRTVEDVRTITVRR